VRSIICCFLPLDGRAVELKTSTAT
jgi:hypothetical protein